MNTTTAVFVGALALAGWTGRCECAELYRVSGTVVDAESGAPLQRARVTLAPHEKSEAEATQVTGADGRFSFDVPEGKYVLNAVYRGLREMFGQRVPGTGLGTTVITGAGLDTSALTFRWRDFGAMTGKVTDEWGEPVEAALVQLLRQSLYAGARQVKTYAWAWTNDLGEYHFGPLAAGTYYVVVTGHPWYSHSGMISTPAQEDQESATYSPRFYPNATDPAGAAPLVVKAGGEARADVTLTSTPGASIRVHIAGFKRGTQGLQLYVVMDESGGRSPIRASRACTRRKPLCPTCRLAITRCG